MVSDPLFNAAFHRSPIGQYLLAPTDKLEILAVNDSFLRAVSRSREDLLGMPLFEGSAMIPTTLAPPAYATWAHRFGLPLKQANRN
jgi:hypothetical protein